MAYQQPINIIAVNDVPMVPAGFIGHAMGPFGLGKDWMPCDGRVLKATDYPELYKAIGSSYGSPAPGTFQLPDIMPMVPTECVCGHNSLIHLLNDEHVCEMGCKEFSVDNLEWLILNR